MGLSRVDTGLAERLLYPVIPAAVTAEYDGVTGGMLAAWWMQTSFNPLMVAVAIAPERYTYKLVSKAGVYALNLLPYDALEAAPFLGDISARFMRDKLERSGLTIRRGEVLGAPLIEAAYAALELRLHSRIPAGDHDIFLGIVEAAYAGHPVEEGMWRLEGFKPLMYLGRTRRPGPVRRVYITPAGWERSELEYAAGMKSLVEARLNLSRRIKEIVETSNDRREAVERVRSLLEELGLDPEDASLLVEDALRSLQHG